MPQPDVIRLQHMLDSARVALMLADGKTRDDLTQDIGHVLALRKSVENIGEAEASCRTGSGKNTQLSRGTGSSACAIG